MGPALAGPGGRADLGERSGDSERLHSFSTVALASLSTPRGQKAMDEAAETTSSPSSTHGNSTPTGGHSVTRLLAHSGDTKWHTATSPILPCHPRMWPLNTKAQTLMRTLPLANAGSVLEDACTHVCTRVLKSLSPRMSGSHVFKIQAHFSEVISGKMLTLITAIKGKYCLSQHKRLFGTRLKSTGIFV